MSNGMASAGPGTSSTGAEHPHWEKLDADYFIAPWKKRGFSQKEGGEDARMLSENSHAHLIRVLEWSRDGAEVWIYGNEPLLK